MQLAKKVGMDEKMPAECSAGGVVKTGRTDLDF